MSSDSKSKKLVLELPNVEGIFIRKLLHNPKRHFLLEGILPGVFSSPLNKLVIFIMKQLYFKKQPLSENNILLYYIQAKEVRTFRWKYKIPLFTQSEILEVIDPVDHLTSDELFDETYDMLTDLAFRRYTYQKFKDIAYHLQYTNHQAEISAISKSISNLHLALQRSKVKTKRGSSNGIREAIQHINESQATIPTFSKEINKLIFGWTRGYPNSLLARSSHGKSTFIYNEIRHKVSHNIVGKIAIISPEEDKNTFWRRAVADEFNLPIPAMRAGLVKVTDEQADNLEAKYAGKVDFFHDDMVRYNRVVDLLYSLEDYEMIFIDHVTAIEYPGSGNALQNLAGGIISLVHRETDFLAKHKDTTIINVNQVREKDIEAQIKGYWKAPTYTMAYGNSVTYVACREWITLYYPYRDLINRSHEWMGVQDLPTANDLYFAVEKSSFGDIGSGVLGFMPNYARLFDRPQVNKSEAKENIQEVLFEIEKKSKSR